MTKICLIQTPVAELRDDRLDPPMGLLYMATELKSVGWDVEICDLSGLNPEQYNIPFAHYYGFSTYTANYHLTLYIKNLLRKQYPDSIMIAGGPHASALPNEVIKDFDYVVVGEGELAIQEILEDKHEVGTIVKSDPIMNLDKLPFVDYSLIDLNSYHRMIQGNRALPIFSSRGCPFACAFCSSYNGYRKRSPKHFVGEICKILSKYPDMRFRIKDDLFVKSIDWLKEFVAMLPTPIKYDCLVRAGYDPQVPMLLKDSGCTLASLGIESGSDIVLKKMNKGATSKMNREAIKGLKDVNIETLAWMIVGFPGETWNTVKETVEFLNESAPDIVTIYTLIPYPGTDVCKHPEKYGMRIIDKDFSHYFYIKGNYDAGYVYETDALNPGIIQEMRQYMIDNVKNSDIR